MTNRDNLNQAILSIASKKASTDSSQSRHLEKMGTRYSGRGSAHFQYTFPNEQNQLTVPGFVAVDPGTNLISQYLAKLIKPKKKTEIDKKSDKPDRSSDIYNSSRQIVANMDIKNHKLDPIGLKPGDLGYDANFAASILKQRQINIIDAAKNSKELETTNENTTESHMNNILKNKIKNQCYNVLSERFYNMFLESPQGAGANTTKEAVDPPRKETANEKETREDLARKAKAKPEAKSESQKPIPGVAPVEPTNGGGGTPPKDFDSEFKEDLPTLPTNPVPTTLVKDINPAGGGFGDNQGSQSGGGGIGGGPPKPTESPAKSTESPAKWDEGPKAPPLAGEAGDPTQKIPVVQRKSNLGLFAPFFNNAGPTETMSAAAGVAQSSLTREGPNGRVFTAGSQRGKSPLRTASWLFPTFAALGTVGRAIDTAILNADDSTDIMGEIGDVWPHLVADLFGYSATRSGVALANRAKDRQTSPVLFAKGPRRGSTKIPSHPVSHTGVIQLGLGKDPNGMYSKLTTPFVPTRIPFSNRFTTGTDPQIFKPHPNYNGFDLLASVKKNWPLVVGSTVGIGTVGAAVSGLVGGSDIFTQTTGSQTQDQETAERRNGNVPNNNLMAYQAPDTYARWVANFKNKWGSPIGGQGVDVRETTPLAQRLELSGPDPKSVWVRDLQFEDE